MTDAQFKAMRATMPWTEQAINNGKHTIIRVIDRFGTEVPLLTLVAFLIGMSQRLAPKETVDG